MLTSAAGDGGWSTDCVCTELIEDAGFHGLVVVFVSLCLCVFVCVFVGGGECEDNRTPLSIIFIVSIFSKFMGLASSCS